MLKALTKREREIIEATVQNMTRRGRRDYDFYIESTGLSLSELEDINATYAMTDKGWLIKPCDMLELNSIHLTKEAWSRYALDEWEEIEEEILEQERGDDSGSW